LERSVESGLLNLYQICLSLLRLPCENFRPGNVAVTILISLFPGLHHLDQFYSTKYWLFPHSLFCINEIIMTSMKS